jgi:6-pyruvoyltetrahydropterin/6-carboxytetrahydropterin synthase
MFEIEKTFSFEAGHTLELHDGKCSQPHGHSYILKVRVRSESLQESGPKKNMVIDFRDISSLVKPMIKEHLDHKWLNNTLETDSPTAEAISQWIYNFLKPNLPHLYSITLFETPTSMVVYTEQP